jgi:hypothetical protein
MSWSGSEVERSMSFDGTKLAGFVLPVLILPLLLGAGSLVYFGVGLGDAPRAVEPSYIIE